MIYIAENTSEHKKRQVSKKRAKKGHSKQAMNINDGTIGVKTGAEIFGEIEYTDTSSIGIYRYDALNDKEMYFSERDYYFVLYHSDYIGMFNDVWKWN